MSDSQDRIAVPTNGHRPPLPAEPAAGGSAATDASAPASAPTGGPTADEPTADELRVAFTPGQMAAGFGIIAALILLVVGRRRGKRG